MVNRKLLSGHLAPTSFNPAGIDVVKAEGNYLYSSNGERYFDLIAGISVCNLGHNNEHIKEAIIAQLQNHTHVMVYGEYSQEIQNKLAAKLCSLLPPQLNSCFFMNSGGEAIDTAMKLAKRVTKKTGFIAHTQAYHGSSQGPLSLMDNDYYTAKYRPLLNEVQFVEQNDLRGIDDLDWKNVAAVIVEPIQAEKGVSLSNPIYLQKLRDYCTKNNCLLVFDEIQTGMGRTGTMFAWQHYGIVPDILVLGKALGGGLPLSAAISSLENMSMFAENPILGNLTTFGGNPLSCAASLKAVELTEKLLENQNLEEKERLFKQKLHHPKIKEVRGKGLFLALEFNTESDSFKALHALKDEGVVSDWFLNNVKCIRIAPSLLITPKEIEYVCEKIFTVCETKI